MTSGKPVQNAWIIGAGRFGALAADRLKNRYRITLVDLDQAALERIEIPGTTKIRQDGIQYLLEHLTPDTGGIWVVPCLPIHLAWEWGRRVIGPDRLIPFAPPVELDLHLPNSIRPGGPHVYVSNADFTCPENCSEPGETCTSTGRPRKKDMYARVESIRFRDFCPIVLKSRQLAPGVGGYRPYDLFHLADRITGTNGNLLVTTACRCHGVITGGRHRPEL